MTFPLFKRYEGEHLTRIALPLGGIGTGTVSLGGRGDLRDWEVVNRPAKGFAPEPAFFALRVQAEGEAPVTRCLEGPLSLTDYEGAFGSVARHAGLPRFRRAAFEAAYPLAQIELSDADVPVTARLQAFNPFVPADANASGFPIAVLRWVLTNTSDVPVEASVCAALQNFVGNDGTTMAAKGNLNEFRREGELSGVFGRSKGVPREAETWGSLALAVLNEDEVTHRTAWAELSWGDALLDFWDDLHDDGRLEERPFKSETPVMSLCAHVKLAPGESRAVTFLLGWHFPNRQVW